MNDADLAAPVDERESSQSTLPERGEMRDVPPASNDFRLHGADTLQGPYLEVTGQADRNSRREEILEGAAQLFADYGFHGASVRDISRRVGISHPGMLHHFETKEALLHTVIDRLEAHAQEAMNRVDELATEPHTFLRGLTEIWHPASPRIQLLAMLTTDTVSEDHPGRFRTTRLRRVHEHVLERCFERFAERGQLRAGIDPPFASRALMDLVLGHAVREKTVRAMQNGPHDDSPIEDLAKLLNAFLKG